MPDYIGKTETCQRYTSTRIELNDVLPSKDKFSLEAIVSYGGQVIDSSAFDWPHWISI
jgi:hypothetical protein